MKALEPQGLWGVDCLLRMTIVLDSDEQVDEDWASAPSPHVHALLAATLPGSGSQGPGRLKKPHNTV